MFFNCSIEAGERLPEEAYLIYKNTDHSGARSKFVERDEVTLNAATDPNFINNFYGRYCLSNSDLGPIVSLTCGTV